VSLRLRLLVAVGAIALIALVVADFATYSSLRSFLYKEDDQSMAQNPLRLTRFLEEGTCPSPSNTGPFSLGGTGGGATPAGAGGGGGGFGYYPFIEIQTSGGKALGQQCPAYVGSATYSPRLPSELPRPSKTIGAADYFTTAATKSGGPAFRVQVSWGTADNTATGATEDVLIVVGAPIGGTTNTLHTLLLIELAVTAGALVLAMAGGWWLVRLGLRPLEDVERTADSIAAGNLDQRVPGADDTTEVGRLARALNVMLERIEAAFSAREASTR
jgi:HAMP domain-containing protein